MNNNLLYKKSIHQFFAFFTIISIIALGLPLANNLYVNEKNSIGIVDEQNDVINLIPESSAINTPLYIETWGAYGGDGTSGTSPKEFNAPIGITINTLGQIFIADFLNSRIQVIDINGTHLYDISTTYMPSSVFYDDSDGTLYYGDFWTNSVFNLYTNGTIISSFGSSGDGDGEFSGPYDLDVNNTHILVADTNNNRIQMFDKSGAFIDKWGANGGDGTSGAAPGEFHFPKEITKDGDGNIYIIDEERVQKFDSAMNYIDEISLIHNNSFGIYYDGVNDIICISNAFYDTSLNWLMNFTDYGIALDEVYGPSGYLIFDDILYVLDGVGNRTILFEINPTPGELTPPDASVIPNLSYTESLGSIGSGIGEYNSTAGICVNGSGYIFIADALNDRIDVLDPRHNHQFYIDIFMPTGLACDKTTDIIYVTQGYGNNVTMMMSDGSAQTSVGTLGSGDGQFAVPHDIYVNETHVIVADSWNNRTQLFDKNLAFIDKFGANSGNGTSGTGPGEFTVPRGIAIDSEGYIYITEDEINCVQKFDAAMNYIRSFSYNGSKGYGIYYDPEYNILMMGDGMYNLTGEKIADFEGLGVDAYIWDIERSNNLIYLSEGNNNQIHIFKLINDSISIPTSFTYRSVFGANDITAEFWRFNGTTQIDSTFSTMHECTNVLKYNLTTSTWGPHPMLMGPEIISSSDDTNMNDTLVPELSWDNTDTIWIPNLIWDYNLTGTEIGNILGASYVNTLIYDIMEAGLNWVRFSSSNIYFQGYLVYVCVDSNGILQEFQHKESGRDIVHLIMEDDVSNFLLSLSTDFGDSEPIYLITTSGSQGDGTSSGDGLPSYQEATIDDATLYRYTPTETITVVETYNNDNFDVLLNETKAISAPTFEVQTTYQVAEVEYFDETFGIWMPADNGQGGNTFIIGSANSETIMPVIMGKDLAVPLVIPVDAPLPSEEDVRDIFGLDVGVLITENSLYVEYTDNGINYYLDVEYSEDGGITSIESRLPTTHGVVESDYTFISEEEANTYVEDVMNDLEPVADNDPEEDDLLLYFIPAYIMGGISLIIGIVNKSQLNKIKKAGIPENLAQSDE